METETVSRDKGPAEAEENTELHAEQIKRKSQIDTEVPGARKLNPFVNKLTLKFFSKLEHMQWKENNVNE